MHHLGEGINASIRLSNSEMILSDGAYTPEPSNVLRSSISRRSSSVDAAAVSTARGFAPGDVLAIAAAAAAAFAFGPTPAACCSLPSSAWIEAKASRSWFVTARSSRARY